MIITKSRGINITRKKTVLPSNQIYSYIETKTYKHTVLPPPFGKKVWSGLNLPYQHTRKKSSLKKLKYFGPYSKIFRKMYNT